MSWDKVKEALPEAKALAYDGCHKLYVALDSEQVEEFRKANYGDQTDESELVMADSFRDVDEMFAWLKTRFQTSCELRFIESVETNSEDPNAGFKDLVGQFEVDS